MQVVVERQRVHGYGHEVRMRCVKVTIKGRVQGVGFRPFCYRLARSIGLGGYVLNSGEGVELALTGSDQSIEDFLKRLPEEAPPLSSIESMEVKEIDGVLPDDFYIKESVKHGKNLTLIPPDISICDQCLKELLDPRDRRYLYPFINCTNCGPRYTIVESMPYDRAKTTMAVFEMCKSCNDEYVDSANRRFHAEPTCCPQCGPKVVLLEGDQAIEGGEALDRTARLLRQGKVVAIKGLGGFHMACDAFDSMAVNRVRSFKRRPVKPLAVMMSNIEIVRTYLQCTAEEEALLLSARRPIVLVEKQPGFCKHFEAIAPTVDHVGVMLPYTPLHYLLMSFYRAPEVLVMTSANKKDEPIVKDNHEAVEKLRGLVDAILFHNRTICRRVDDSVTSVVLRKEHIIRRARGYAPTPIKIRGKSLRNVVAFGADLKNCACIGFGDNLVLTQHVGDLDSPDVQDHLMEQIDGLKRLMDVDFDLVVTDMHPDYHSSGLGRAYAESHGIELKSVQHHFAHLLQVVAEHDLEGPVIGCILDGTGYGLDGKVWGGEVLYCDVGCNKSVIPGFLRLGHLEYMPLPGGDRAAREPWRMAVSVLYSFGNRLEFLAREFESEAARVLEIIKKGINSPLTSSAGRLFDAVASILGVCHFNGFEGQAAMELEAMAMAGARHTAGVKNFSVSTGWKPLLLEGFPEDGSGYPVEIKDRMAHPWIISSSAVINAILDDMVSGVSREQIALKFHRWVASSMMIAVTNFARQYEVHQVVLSGGVFQNRLLLQYFTALLKNYGLKVYTGDTVPVNDGGIALGQAYYGGVLSCV